MKHTFKFVLAGALCAPVLAHACSCVAPPAPKIALEKSAAVFVGRVTSIEKSGSSNKYQFSVSKQWKGVDGNTASIVTTNNSAACGINFDQDRDYLIYASKTEGDAQLRTNLCSRTKRAADAGADLAELGAPVKYANASKYTTSQDGVVQLNVGRDSNPFILLTQALQNNGSAQRFRLNWMGPNGYSANGTSLYNRADSTLKSYSRFENGAQINISSVLYAGVTDAVLQKLASTNETEQFFRTYANYGVTKKDTGSKMVSLSG